MGAECFVFFAVNILELCSEVQLTDLGAAWSLGVICSVGADLPFGTDCPMLPEAVPSACSPVCCVLGAFPTLVGGKTLAPGELQAVPSDHFRWLLAAC